MSTLLRTNGSASKLIAGCYPVGAQPSHPGPNHTKVVPTKDPAEGLLTTQSLQNLVTRQANYTTPFSGLQSVKNIAVISRRYVHTDVNFPNFDPYRLESTKDPNVSGRETEDARKAVPTSIIFGVGGMLALFSGKQIGTTLAAYKGMAGDQMALANIEVDLNEIPEGKCKTYEWRGKPVFVRHRTAKQVEEVRAVTTADLRHPQTDEERVKKPEWTVLIGICTHLGCVPFAGMGDFDGYYCPCHGSHYDASGRIRKGPAPLNLHIPEYTFLSDDKIRVG